MEGQGITGKIILIRSWGNRVGRCEQDSYGSG